jgi:ketosteroid isomerase-like protein
VCLVSPLSTGAAAHQAPELTWGAPAPASKRGSSGLSLAACGQHAREEVASMDVTAHIISLERSALDRWIRADPDGYLSLYAANATYFDPFREKRIDGLDELKARMAAMRGVTLPFKEPRYDMINPVVQVEGKIAVLSFNLVNYGKPSGSAAETVLARWNATEVYREIDGEWRIIHTHWSFTQPQLAGPPPI